VEQRGLRLTGKGCTSDWGRKLLSEANFHLLKRKKKKGNTTEGEKKKKGYLDKAKENMPSKTCGTSGKDVRTQRKKGGGGGGR